MTQAAVSYQVRILEHRSGGPLFYRRARGVELTREGKLLAGRASEAFSILHEAFTDVQRERNEVLSIASLPTFGARILAPRLGTFQSAHPQISTRLSIFPGDADTPSEGASVTIRFGSANWAEAEVDKLMSLTLTPMVAPDFVRRHGPFNHPSDLLGVPLINSGHSNWRRWFEKSGVYDSPPPRATGYETVRTQLFEAEAVLAGHGACLLTPLYFREALAKGDLVRPFNTQVDLDVAVWLVVPSHRRGLPGVRAFRAWLRSEMSRLNQV